MSWIASIPKSEANGELAELYSRIASERSDVANILAIQGVNPKVLARHFDLYVATVFGKSPLSRAEREIIALVVSVANNCFYCKSHHAEALHQLGFDKAMLKAIKVSRKKADLSPKLKAICDFSEKLTLRPRSVVKADIDKLRAVGLDDRAIHDVVATTAYFNMANRIAMGLGVELEENFEQTCG
ncbi:MAG: peroxidase-related enzyme [Planctomycetota bacterium]